MTARFRNKGWVLLGVALGCAGFVLPMLDDTARLSIGLYFIATTLATIELLDIAARYWLGRTLSARQAQNVAAMPAAGAARPFALILSVRNLKAKAMRALAPLEPYKSHVWIIDDGSDDDTAAYLEFLGWRCLRAEENRKKPGAIKALLQRLPADIVTVMVLDPDCEPLNSGKGDIPDLERAIQKFQESGAAACCPRVRIREGGVLPTFQMLEIELAFVLGRKSMSPHCITSGVSIYARAALENALTKHSLSVYAEDLENSLIILEEGLDIGYDEELVVVTDGKATFRSWFSQRVGWSFGLIRVFSQRWRSLSRLARRGPWISYNLVVYLGLLTILLFPVRFAGTLLFAVGFANALDALLSLDLIPDNRLTDPRYFAGTYATYVLLCACLYAYVRPSKKPSTAATAVVFYPFYAAAQTLAMCVGYANWISFCTIGKRVYRDHYESEIGLERRSPSPVTAE